MYVFLCVINIIWMCKYDGNVQSHNIYYSVNSFVAKNVAISLIWAILAQIPWIRTNANTHFIVTHPTSIKSLPLSFVISIVVWSVAGKHGYIGSCFYAYQRWIFGWLAAKNEKLTENVWNIVIPQFSIYCQLCTEWVHGINAESQYFICFLYEICCQLFPF